MGIEYKIEIPEGSKGKVKALLKRSPWFDQVESFEGRDFYTYRLNDKHSEMPNGCASFEEEKLYYCNYGNGKYILDHLVTTLQKELGPVKVIEL